MANQSVLPYVRCTPKKEVKMFGWFRQDGFVNVRFVFCALRITKNTKSVMLHITVLVLMVVI